ncbi:molybdopterin-dependent oxidoreductase [Mucilaginibacter sp. Bleaf8]|uniref:molybdopterin-dependent oxidoreductase n=1 Tax=Mucilaginibacter sp. Bleaf8 TaxID=2834430 RepID=UPI001BCAAB91|nr:molybdopterin-dependent oxidoreductase [Mucilaginibacter sp. Bleaf8]MBS7566225.1 molybdopterin-dependent oxidoreductase [Mucilaginibacter sp. Bleaf8]
MKKLIRLASLCAFIGGIVATAQAQSITISGDSLETKAISMGEFQDMHQSVVMAKAHDEKVHRYTGVSLADLLKKAGVMLGDSAKRATVKSYVIVTAADNYRAIYALSEIDPLFANRLIILANRADKKPLPSQDGPFQIIVPGEKKHARWVRQVNSIQLVVVK